jgi:hypothetical protein
MKQVAFKDHIKKHRPAVDVDRVGTGEVWLASQAHVSADYYTLLLVTPDTMCSLCYAA